MRTRRACEGGFGRVLTYYMGELAGAMLWGIVKGKAGSSTTASAAGQVPAAFTENPSLRYVIRV